MTNTLRLQQVAKLLDITRLQDNDTPTEFNNWLDTLPKITPAAYCVYPEFMSAVANWPHKAPSVFMATVVNFPSGDASIDDVCAEIERALALGATEIDCVLPYKALLRGEYDHVKTFLAKVRKACGDTCLKMIIESGELLTVQQIALATELSIESGVNFVKTSTGKVPVGVTAEAARVILTAIAASNKPVGFKASGGVRSITQALEIVDMYEEITGNIATASGLRIGASALANEIANELAK